MTTEPGRRGWSGRTGPGVRVLRLICCLGMLLSCQGEVYSGEDAPSPSPTSADRSVTSTETRATLPGAGPGRSRVVRIEADDWTFRPTVLVRRGNSQGSGTIIASVDGESLVATAAHVIRGGGPVTVELHRYNLGVEGQPRGQGRWPIQISAELVASDLSADVAILRFRGRDRAALPYTARMPPASEGPSPSGRLTSVGIDLGSKLSSWETSLLEIDGLELNDSKIERPFLITAQTPEHGRSGGGLYDAKGRLVAVCVGHAEMQGRRVGIFSSVENVRQLLNAHELASIVARSEARQARTTRSLSSAGLPPRLPARPNVTPTEAHRDATPR